MNFDLCGHWVTYDPLRSEENGDSCRPNQDGSVM